MKNNLEIFEYSDYKLYFKERLRGLPKKGHGEKSKIAKALNCQSTYISQVINSYYHLSLEQAILLSEYWAMASMEKEYFLLLVQLSRAGNENLREFIKSKMNKLLSERNRVVNRVGPSSAIDDKSKSRYYSSWIYAAIHIILSIEGYQSPATISKRLNLSQEKVLEALEFLVDIGLAKSQVGKFQIGENHIHLSSDSPHISKHHQNWRMKAMMAVDKAKPENIHYSLVATLSKKDVLEVRKYLLKSIEGALEIIKLSPKEEEIQCLNIDFFTL